MEAGFQNYFKIEQRKEELTRALHIFIPFNSCDAIWYISVIPWLLFTGIAHLFCEAASAFFTRLVPSLCILFMRLSKEVKGLLEKSRHSKDFFTLCQTSLVFLPFLQPAQLHPSCNRGGWCPGSRKVMCIYSDTLSGAPFPAFGGVVSYTAGSSLQITEPDLFFQLCGHSPCSHPWIVCCTGSDITAALEAPTNCHKAQLNTSEATAVYRCLFKAALL